MRRTYPQCLSFAEIPHMHDDRQPDLSIEYIFENALQRISVQAFDALLACGVRDFEGLLRLRKDDLRQFAIFPTVVSELLAVQGQLKKLVTKVDREPSVVEEDIDLADAA